MVPEHAAKPLEEIAATLADDAQRIAEDVLLRRLVRLRADDDERWRSYEDEAP